MKTESRFALDLDTAAGLVTGFLLLALAFVVVAGIRIGVRVTAQLPADSSLGPFEPLTLAFSEPVDEALAIEKFFIQPEVEGKFEWLDSQTLRFTPTQPMLPDTEYTIALAPGALTANGNELKTARNWKFRTRSPRVVYLVTDKDGSRLWSVDMQGGDPTPLTDETLSIYNFDTAQNGEFIIFAAFNEQGGLDLWRVGRAGGNATQLIECGFDRCTVPAISPGGRLVAYVREAALPGEQAFGAPRIWIYNLETRQDTALYEDGQIIGYGPAWSPDGSRLVSYDGIKDELRLLDLFTTEQLILPSQTGNPITWSHDGGSLIYTDVTSNESGPYTRVHQAKLSLNEIITLFGENDERDYAYSALAWSPVESKLLIGLRPNADDPSTALWLMDPYTRDGQVIVDQPGYAYNDPHWDLWGQAVVFQQFNFKGVYKPEVALWKPGFDQPQVLAEGLMPHWLP